MKNKKQIDWDCLIIASIPKKLRLVSEIINHLNDQIKVLECLDGKLFTCNNNINPCVYEYKEIIFDLTQITPFDFLYKCKIFNLVLKNNPNF